MTLLNDSVVHIPTSKLKVVLILLGCIGFVAAGIFMLYMARSEPIAIAIFAKVFGLLGIGFFGLCGFVISIMLFDTQPRITLDPIGIIVRSSGTAVERVAWEDIRRIDVTQVESQRFLTFQMKDPQRYLQRGKLWQRQLNRLSYHFYGGPVHISAGTLKISFGELTDLVFQYHERYGSNLSQS